MFPVTRAVFKSKRIYRCVEALLRPPLTAKTVSRIMEIRLGVRKSKRLRIHIQRTIDQDQLQSKHNRAMVMLDPSTRG